MSWHVPLPAHLALEPWAAHIEGYFAFIDRDLRLRKSIEKPGCYVLERRCRQQPFTNLGMHELDDLHVQARDGYIHVSHVHPAFLAMPWAIVEGLTVVGADLWAEGGAAKFADELEYEEHWTDVTKARRRTALFHDVALDAYDTMARTGQLDPYETQGTKTRFTNPGLTPAT